MCAKGVDAQRSQTSMLEILKENGDFDVISKPITGRPKSDKYKTKQRTEGVSSADLRILCSFRPSICLSVCGPFHRPQFSSQ